MIADTDRSLVGSGNDTIKYPIRKSPGAQILSATAAASPTDVAWEYVSITVDKRIHSSFQVPYITQKLAAIKLIEKLLDVATLDMARQLDLWVLQVAAGYTEVSDEAVGTGDNSTTEFALDHSPVLEVTSVELDGTPTTDYTVDYDDGKIKFSDPPATDVAITASYAYADSDTHVMHTSSAGSLTVSDVFNASATMKARGFTPNYLIIPPKARYLLENNLISKFQFTQTTDKVPGLVGAIGDIKVIETDLLPDSYAVMLKAPPDNPAVVKVHASNVEVRKMDRPDYARTDVFLDEFVKPVRVLPDAVQVIIGFASNAY